MKVQLPVVLIKKSYSDSHVIELRVNNWINITSESIVLRWGQGSGFSWIAIKGEKLSAF